MIYLFFVRLILGFSAGHHASKSFGKARAKNIRFKKSSFKICCEYVQAINGSWRAGKEFQMVQHLFATGGRAEGFVAAQSQCAFVGSFGASELRFLGHVRLEQRIDRANIQVDQRKQ